MLFRTVMMGKTLTRYIIREISLPFVFTLLVLTFVLLMGRILQLMDLMVNKGVSVIDILRLIIYLIPTFLVITVPVSLLIAILIGLGRLSRDNEITVLKSAGVGLYQFIPPLAIVSVLATVITALMAFTFVPLGYTSSQKLLYEIAAKGAGIGIKEKVFNDFNGLILYAEKIPVSGTSMEKIFIVDKRFTEEQTTIIAERGYLLSNPSSAVLTVQLQNGSAHSVEKDLTTYKKLDFDTYSINIDVTPSLTHTDRKKSAIEMSFGELRKAMRDADRKDAHYREYIIELHKKFTMPFSCLLFGLLGVPLGIVKSRTAKSYGFVVGLCTIMVYYILSLSGEALGETGRIPAALGTWTPSLLFAVSGTILFFQAARERNPFSRVEQFFRSALHRVRRHERSR